MAKKTIGIVVGSLRKDSFSKVVARCLAGQLEGKFDVKIVNISDLALYDADLDNDRDIPLAWQRLRQEVKALDAVLFVTPEYNRSIPAVLKNALDVASRPYGANAWSGKPGAVVSVSPGRIGAFGASHHLRQIASVLNILMMQLPEMYIGDVVEAVNADGVSDENVLRVLEQFSIAFADWINRLTA